MCFTSSVALSQTEAMKDVMNNLAFYYKKNDAKYLAEAKKSVDASFKTHIDSIDYGKNVYKAIVYASIVYIDSLNKLNLPDTFLLQTTKLVNRLIADRRLYKYKPEMNYARGCIANVYLRKAYAEYWQNNYRLAINNFNVVKKYVPAAKEPNIYLANIYYKLGNYKSAVVYYDSLLLTKTPKLEYIQSAVNVYKTLGYTTQALQAIQQGLEIYPHDRYLIFEEANIYNNQNNFTLLKPLLDELIAASPNNADVIFIAANCYDHLNEFDKAEELYQRTIELSSVDYNPIFDLGLLYLKKAVQKQGQPEYQADLAQSRNWLEKANEMAPNSEMCLKTLQMLYLQTNNTDDLKRVNDKLKQLND